jgi:hypothetical protein
LYIIHHSQAQNSKNAKENAENVVPSRKVSLNPSGQQHAMSEVSHSQSAMPCQQSLSEKKSAQLSNGTQNLLSSVHNDYYWKNKTFFKHELN